VGQEGQGPDCFFGVWADPQKALERWLAEKDDLLAGRKPRVQSEGLTMRELANRFLTHKQRLHDTGEITTRTWKEYFATCECLLEVFGSNRLVTDLIAEDFEGLRAKFATVCGLVRLGNEIQRARSVFKFAWDSELIDRPLRFGPGFKRPSNKTLRIARSKKGPKTLSAAEIRNLLEIASPQLKAMILLGINAGFGNEDVATLPIEALDLEAGWAQFPRPKTGIERKCKLWPETITAIQEVLGFRHKPKNEAHANYLFITKFGLPWSNEKYGTAITHEMSKLLKQIAVQRVGVNFYALRHTFETIGGETRDQVAVDALMGHYDATMAGVYREHISDERRIAVANQVHIWLFGDAKLEKARRITTTTSKSIESQMAVS
jgi:integrase